MLNSVCLHTGLFVRDVTSQLQEPDDGILPRPAPWEWRGKVPLHDAITSYNTRK
ncbi:Uncharacterised protein [Proteus mirabilis]|uniref:Uncharacterized protein n=1 Tax=Proteus mirabilis TaxID=584 RepID=A0A2X2CBH6_PROMI|nr:hypothetical protein [Proteus mirabilis]CAK6605269.1 Innexin [Providencia stuartii]SQA28019.1 Uncharacterised protein [Yersinia enterocolitica]ELA8984506.1 hypothetical protein [Proteus mirabilis]CAK6608984.1 Innexin [Providencia stuartii]SPZ04181.1 Uncharacterised protein [Proteus mirabilis]